MRKFAILAVLALVLWPAWPPATNAGTLLTPCLAPDNAGTADLPAPCPYVSTDGTLNIVTGLPPTAQIVCDVILDNFSGVVVSPGGTLGGEIHQFNADLNLAMTGIGSLAGFTRNIFIPVTVEFHSAPRTPGDPVQDFDTDMFRLEGQLFGDPDFCTLRIQSGSDVGLPSPGHTTLTQQGTSGWNVDSFFDIAYEIEFQGCPGSIIEGFGGVTEGTVRIRQGADFWQPGDGHKMHFPQLPDELGWDVDGSVPMLLGDDWQCSETGWIQDLHFWGSWRHGVTGVIRRFDVSIYSDVPANTDLPYSHPGELLWTQEIGDFNIIPVQTDAREGWYEPFTGDAIELDHQEYFQYDIQLREDQYFWQEEGNIYWLVISATLLDSVATQWGWKSSVDHFNDDATWNVLGETCVQPDNGGGTADLPAPTCPYLTTDSTFHIEDGLPAGSTIESDGSLDNFVNIVSFPGGLLGGGGETFDGVLQLSMTGTGALAGFNRNIAIPVTGEMHHAPRTPGDPVQSFQTDMVELQGQLFGDPDFDFLRIEAGQSFGLPSPGQTTLTELPSGDWQVDSFFDIAYRIEFVGAPGSFLDGLSGTTTDAVRMELPGGTALDWQELYEPPLFVTSLDLSFVVTGSCCEIRTGDLDGVGTYPNEVDSSDLGQLINFLFSPPGTVVLRCVDEADVNAGGGANPVDSSDLGLLVSYLFSPPGTVVLPDCP